MMAFCNTIKKYLRAGLFAGSACVFFLNCSQAADESFNIEFRHGQLSVNLRNSPLEKVLKEIMAQSGARIWLSDSIDSAVTVEFQNVPIGEGVRRILKDKNYAFVYAPHEIREGKLSIITASKSKEVFTKAKEPPPKKPEQPAPKKAKAKKEKPSFEALAKDAVNNEDAGKREDAISALGESHDKRAVEVIANVLANDPSEDVRLSAIDALLEVGAENTVDILSTALKDKDPWVRESAVEALGEVGNEAAIEFVKSAISDEDGSVRELAQEILEELNTKK
jgi:hypothetical protein